MTWITQHPITSILIALSVLALIVWICRKGGAGAILEAIGEALT